MKNLLFIWGPNGIEKTTICKEIMRKLPIPLTLTLIPVGL